MGTNNRAKIQVVFQETQSHISVGATRVIKIESVGHAANSSIGEIDGISYKEVGRLHMSSRNELTD